MRAISKISLACRKNYWYNKITRCNNIEICQSHVMTLTTYLQDFVAMKIFSVSTQELGDLVRRYNIWLRRIERNIHFHCSI